MRPVNVPKLNMRYWIAISLASVFGANMGDFVSHVLHLGHVRGLPILGGILAFVLIAEPRMRLRTQAWYWSTIVVIRTAATNIGDLGTHDLRLSYPALVVGLAALLVLTMQFCEARKQELPVTNSGYWISMLVAGTLGTAGGDYAAAVLGLGLSSLLSSLLLACVLGLFFKIGSPGRGFYWAAIAIVRTWGTNIGDLLVGKHGANLGLYAGTALAGAAFVALLVLWRERTFENVLSPAATASADPIPQDG